MEKPTMDDWSRMDELKSSVSVKQETNVFINFHWKTELYGYVAIDTYIYNNWDTDYQDTAVADVKKSPLIFKWKRERCISRSRTFK